MSNNVFEAAASGDIGYLEKHKSDIGSKNERGWTVLHFAARYGQRQVVDLVLQLAGCDREATNSEGKTAAQVAQFWGYDDIAKLLDTSKQETTTTSSSQQQQQQPFPPNNVNFFAESPLNRYSWYRNDKNKLRELVRGPRARFLVMSELNPLFDDNGIYFAAYDEVASIIEKALPDQDEKKLVPEEDEIILVFLGIDERENDVYWALDVTPKGHHETDMKKLIDAFEARNLEFAPALPRAFTVDKPVAAIIAQARSMVDWNQRHMFCPACGRRTKTDEGGHKRTCPPVPEGETGGAPCISQNGVHNFAYPRTDPVIIVAIVHPTEDKILLGRQTKWPGRMYSCIAGFVEAGESIEEAVRREAYEEAGIRVDRVAYHSSQPWPFPNSLMFGFIAEAVTTDIKLEDKELESAIWFTHAEVQAVLDKEPNTKFTLPPKTAIAYQLVKSWATEGIWRSKNQSAKM
ncbi:peroxisomal NADH pyrophosphatase NUDT12-like protein [Lichtheimia hyalospora FSU 10163]|nr:peroxisomal NADH pyrophosphatase NUDT12-like protein [Lichtheimia hyalospora FSU 10163]